MKIVIVMTYYDRLFQLTRTLESLKLSHHKDFEVVVVDDCSSVPAVHSITEYPVHIITTKGKNWINPEPAYNTGLYYAMKLKPDIIIVQNAECYHVGDVISYAARVTNETYISFGCFSLDEATTFNDHNIIELLQKYTNRARNDGELAWYNHPLYRPCAFDFCAAITANNMKRLNGYDERFSAGWAYGDNYLLARVKMLGLRVEITEAPLVVHQWHYNQPVPKDSVRLNAQNLLLYKNLVKKFNYRAEHIYTDNL
jgi:glycosyltransferase involved in cell wall biosynthesis